MKIDKDALKKQVILHLPYLLFLLVFAKLGEAVRLAPGADASQKLLGLSEGFALAFQSMWPGAALDWLVGLCGAAAVRLAVYLKGKDAKKYRKNVEYGSARWGNKTDIAPFMDPKPENNVILTQSEGLMLNGRPKNPAHARNKNVLVVGGSGSGKTRFFIFKTFVATYLLTNCFTIVMAVFDVAQNVVSQSAGVINGSLDVEAALADLSTQLEAMGMWELIGLWLETNIINLCMWVLSIVIFVIVYGRMIEIYLTVSLAPIPFSTMANREWGQMGTGYLRSLFALGFQGFLILVCVAIYAVLVQSIPASGDIHGAIWGTAGYTVLLAFALFKTGSLSKSIFNAR